MEKPHEQIKAECCLKLISTDFFLKKIILKTNQIHPVENVDKGDILYK